MRRIPLTDFQMGIARVFPEETFVAQAKHLVDTAVKINEATVLPMVSFVGTGAPVEAELVEVEPGD